MLEGCNMDRKEEEKAKRGSAESLMSEDGGD
jgi:hypothetical protein